VEPIWYCSPNTNQNCRRSALTAFPKTTHTCWRHTNNLLCYHICLSFGDFHIYKKVQNAPLAFLNLLLSNLLYNTIKLLKIIYLKSISYKNKEQLYSFSQQECLPSNRSFSSRRELVLSLRSCFSISWLIRFCSKASSLKQQAIVNLVHRLAPHSR